MTRHLLPCAAVAVCFILPVRAAEPPEATKAPAPTAVALLRIAQDQDDRTDYRIFRNSQAVLVKSRRVIKEALRKPGIADLAVVKAQKDHAAWLEENLQVSFPLDGEILRVTLRVGKPSEAAKLVNAVVETYLEEFVTGDHTRTAARLEALKKLSANYAEKLQDMRAVLKRLAREAGTRDAEVQGFKQRFPTKQLAAVEQELLHVQADLRKLQMELAVQDGKEKTPREGPPAAALDEQVWDAEVQERQRAVARLELILDTVKAKSGNPDQEPLYQRTQQQLEQARVALDARKEVRSARAKELQEKQRAEDKARAVALRERIDVLKLLEKTLTTEAERLDKEVRQLKSADLETLREEIAQLEVVQKKVAAEVESLQVERATPPRITLIENAEAPGAD